MAAELEVKGAGFYDRLGAAVVDNTIRAMCAWLSQQEYQHERDFRAIAGAQQDLQSSQEYSVDICEIMSTAMARLSAALGGNVASPQELI